MRSRGLFSLSVAGCVVKPETAYFIMAIKFRRYNKTALFFTKRAVIVELLGRFELPTSSLPNIFPGFSSLAVLRYLSSLTVGAVSVPGFPVHLLLLPCVPFCVRFSLGRLGFVWFFPHPLRP